MPPQVGNLPCRCSAPGTGLLTAWKKMEKDEMNCILNHENHGILATDSGWLLQRVSPKKCMGRFYSDSTKTGPQWTTQSQVEMTWGLPCNGPLWLPSNLHQHARIINFFRFRSCMNRSTGVMPPERWWIDSNLQGSCAPPRHDTPQEHVRSDPGHPRGSRSGGGRKLHAAAGISLRPLFPKQCDENLSLQLWPEMPVISTNKTSFIGCIIP